MARHKESGIVRSAFRRGVDIVRGVGETVTAVSDEAQLVVDGPERTNDLFSRFPAEPYELPGRKGETRLPVQYYDSQLMQIAFLVDWERLNAYAARHGLHAVRYRDRALMLLMVADHRSSTVGQYREYLCSMHVSSVPRSNLGAVPSLASLLAYNPLGLHYGDGLLIGEVSVTAQNTTFPDARDVGNYAYGLNKTIGDIDVTGRRVSVSIPAGKISFSLREFAVPLPVALSTPAFSTGTAVRQATRFQFEIRSWLKPARIRDLEIVPGEQDKHGFMTMLTAGKVIGGLVGAHAQAVLGYPMPRCRLFGPASGRARSCSESFRE